MKKLCTITTVPATLKAFLSDQLVHLSMNGYNITVITSTESGAQDFNKELPNQFNYKYITLKRTIRPVEDLKALISITRILKKEKFDIVQYVTPKAALLGSVAAWISKIPNRLYLLWGFYFVTQSGLRRTFFKLIERIVCKLSTSIAPDSYGNLEIAIKEKFCNPKKIEVVGYGSANGVDVVRFNPVRLQNFKKLIRDEYNIPQHAFLFGTIAAITRDKGINELIRAFIKVIKQADNVFLLIIGQTTEKDPVDSDTLETINKCKKIINVGWQSEPEKFLAALDAFVLPTYREGFGVVNIEAGAMQLPVISTDVPGPNESIISGKTGILVPPKTIDPLEKAMLYFIRNPESAKILGIAGRERVMKFYEQKNLWRSILIHRNKIIQKS